MLFILILEVCFLNMMGLYLILLVKWILFLFWVLFLFWNFFVSRILVILLVFVLKFLCVIDWRLYKEIYLVFMIFLGLMMKVKDSEKIVELERNCVLLRFKMDVVGINVFLFF